MNEVKPPKKSMVYYYLIMIVVLLCINAWIVPALSGQKIQEVDYSTFLNMLDEKSIAQVEIQDNQIAFNSNQEGNKQIYVTGRIEEDTELVNRLQTAGVQFSRVIEQESSPLVAFLITWLGPILIIVLLGQIFMRSMKKRMGGQNAMIFGGNDSKMYVPATSGKRFDDVAGQDEAKEALTEIVDFLHDPERYRKIGARLPKGALLVGPPGTGKTLLAQAVAGEAQVPFFAISGSEFVQMFVGMGAARVRDLFKQAQEKAPCIVFIDEIDAIGKKRDASGLGGNDEREQTLNQLLTEMDGFDASKGVVILAASNRPETLDQALLRPGRFDRRIPVELPDLKGREAILKVHAKNIQVDAHVDFGLIARSTSGASGAELANIVNEAALGAVKHNRQSVLQEDLEEAVEVVIAGYQRKGAVINDREKRIIATHEIGHALVSANLKKAAPVHKITIVPRTSGALGYTMQVEEGENVLMTKEQAMDRIITYTGGRAAEEVMFGEITSGASNDIEQATKLARAMVTRFGMSREFDMMALETVNNQYLGGDTQLMCSSETAAKVDEEVLALIKRAHETAKEILTQHRAKLDELSAYLLEKETITGEEFMHILRG